MGQGSNTALPAIKFERAIKATVLPAKRSATHTAESNICLSLLVYRGGMRLIECLVTEAVHTDGQMHACMRREKQG